MEILPAIAAQLSVYFGPADAVALAVLATSALVASRLIERPGKGWPSTSVLMDRHRTTWMRELAGREVRIMDAQLFATLRAGAAFFASTCLLSIGGVAALIGQADRLVGVVRDLGAGGSGVGAAAIWEAKLLVVLLLVVNAFLKFVWSHRLFGYVAVLMGAIPAPGAEGVESATRRADTVLRAAGRSFNRGLRAIYFAIAALAWFLGPWALAVASLLTFAMLMRREFFSVSRRALLDP